MDLSGRGRGVRHFRGCWPRHTWGCSGFFLRSGKRISIPWAGAVHGERACDITSSVSICYALARNFQKSRNYQIKEYHVTFTFETVICGGTMDGFLAMDQSDATAAAASGDAAAAAAHDGMHSHGPPADDGAAAPPHQPAEQPHTSIPEALELQGLLPAETVNSRHARVVGGRAGEWRRVAPARSGRRLHC